MVIDKGALLIGKFLAIVAVVAFAAAAEAREEIRIAGSSTVFPFATLVADEFGQTTGFKTPVVESTGTGGGIKLFCAGVGAAYPDIVNASRRIKESERAICAENGVAAITEIRFGFDGIVIANARSAPRFDLTLRQLFLALAKRVPRDGELVANPYRRWREIDPALPDMKIEVMGPPPTSGTRDAFVERAMEGGCGTFPEIAALKHADKPAYQAVCHAIREDGAYIEAGENDNLVVQKLGANPNALGIFGFSFLNENADRLQGSLIGGVEPSFENIAAGIYPISRSLYFYVKNAHVGITPGIVDYVRAFTDERTWGPWGYLANRGLIPLPEDERRAARAAALQLAALQPAALGAPGVRASSGPSLLLVAAVLVILSAIGYAMGRRRAQAAVAGAVGKLHSLPGYYGYYVAIWCGLPGFAAFVLWLVLEPRIIEALVLAGLPEAIIDQSVGGVDVLLDNIKSIARGEIPGRAVSPALEAAAERYNRLDRIGFAGLAATVLALATGGLAYSQRAIGPALRARNRVEAVLRSALAASSVLSILITVGIVLSLLFETIRFFDLVSLTEFLFGLDWSPQTAIRADQVGSSGAFGAVPLFAGTLLITLIAMSVAVPVGLFSAIYMSEYAAPWLRAALKPVLEILAGIPTVVFGFFAALTVAPIFRDAGQILGLDVASESALAAGVVMGIMIIPFVSSLSDDVIRAVPQSLRDGSYALGATKSETIRRVILPAALPGIVGAVLLAISRAIGETMIVVMAAGLAANLTANPLEAVTTVTVQIVTLLVGDQEFTSAKTLAAFALGLMLFLMTLMLNVVALGVVRKYRERYD
jgi:phosphate transport system permease protein